MSDYTMDDFSNAFASTGTKTAVFWNLEDFPFPGELTPCVIRRQIKKSLSKKVIKGFTSIFIYSGKKDFSDEELAEFKKYKLHVSPQVPRDECERFHRILHDIYFWALDVEFGCTYCTERLNLIVICNQIKGEIDLAFCLEVLSANRGYSLLLQPRDIPVDQSNWSLRQGRLLDYGKVICEPSPSHIYGYLLSQPDDIPLDDDQPKSLDKGKVICEPSPSSSSRDTSLLKPNTRPDTDPDLDSQD